jgi:predicted  nucleic acid-binding Zn-ribbon protein
VDGARTDDRAHLRRPELNAAHHDQLRLLDLQGLDTRLAQLEHRRRTLPEHGQIAEYDAQLAQLRDLTVAAETERSDIQREQTKAEADVDQVRQRSARDQRRLDAGQVSSPRELQQLQHEIETLGRRQSDLEDVELEIMERMEDVTGRLDELASRRSAVEGDREAAVARRDAALAEVDSEASLTATMRTTLGGQVDPALVALYEKIREQQGGVGAAALVQRRCAGCRLELNRTELGRIAAAAPDEVLRCEECRRILVRTEESGIG